MGFPFALHPEQQAQPRLANFPDTGLVGRLQGAGMGIAEALPLQVGLQTVQSVGEFCLVIAVELDEKDRTRTALDETDLARKFQRPSSQVEDHVVEQFHRGRAVPEDGLRCPDGVDYLIEVNDHQGGGPRPPFDPNLGPVNQRERALGGRRSTSRD